MGIDLREMAILKMEAAHELLAEAHDCWPADDIRQARDRVADAVEEMRSLDLQERTEGLWTGE